MLLCSNELFVARAHDGRDLMIEAVAEPEEGHPPTTHVAFLIASNHNNKNRYNNCSGAQVLWPLVNDVSCLQ
jgi:hypothetical protein